jgi:Flp pilus assembly pilin Flp
VTARQQSSGDESNAPNAAYDRGMDDAENLSPYATEDDRADERGQGLVEYGMIIMFVAIFVILAVQFLGKQTNQLYSNISNGLIH